MTLIRKNYLKRFTTMLFMGGILGLAADTLPPSHEGYNTPEAPPENSQPVHGKVLKEMYDKELDIHQYILSNNVRVNLKSIPYEENKIAIRASFGRGELEAPNQPALPFVTKLLFMNGGIQTEMEQASNNNIAEKKFLLNFSVGPDDFYFTGSAKDQKALKNRLQLMCAYFTEPVYLKETMDVVHMELDKIYDSLHKTPHGIRKDKLESFLASGDWKFGYPPKNEAMAIKIDQIRSFLEKPLKDSYLELSIVGDFDVQECLKTILETVGTLPQRENSRPFLEEMRHAQFPQTPMKETFWLQDSGHPIAYVMLIWPTVDGWNWQKMLQLEVLSEIFADRLKWLLNKSPYIPCVKNDCSLFYPGYGQFMVYSHASLLQADETLKVFFDSAINLRGQITEEEFSRAIQLILKNVAHNESRTSYWLNVIDCSQEHPIFLQWTQSLKEAYKNMKKEDVQAVVKEFLHPQKAITIKILPQKIS